MLPRLDMTERRKQSRQAGQFRNLSVRTDPANTTLVSNGSSNGTLGGARLLRMIRNNPWRQVQWLIAALCLSPTARGGQTPAVPANDLVRATVQNELKASDKPPARHMFASLKQTASGSQTKLYCETKEAMAGMAIAFDGKPLTVQQRQAEEARLEQLKNSPAELAKKRQREKEDAERITRIVRAMPDAFFFEYDGTMPGQSGLGKDGSEL